MAEPRQLTLWVLRAQAGDREAFDLLLREVQRPLFRYVSGLVCDATLAEDVLQDVFVLIYRKLRWLREPEVFRAWTYRIATREAYRTLARRSGRREDSLDEAAVDSLPATSDAPPDALLLARLPEILERVSPASRAVLTLHYLQELSIEETAEVLGVAVGTVKSRLAYGLARLREEMVRLPGEPTKVQ
jgi:RNA polymerase sigma-70 factor (ECF subfamily)